MYKQTVVAILETGATIKDQPSVDHPGLLTQNQLAMDMRKQGHDYVPNSRMDKTLANRLKELFSCYAVCSLIPRPSHPSVYRLQYYYCKRQTLG